MEAWAARSVNSDSIFLEPRRRIGRRGFRHGGSGRRRKGGAYPLAHLMAGKGPLFWQAGDEIRATDLDRRHALGQKGRATAGSSMAKDSPPFVFFVLPTARPPITPWSQRHKRQPSAHAEASECFWCRTGNKASRRRPIRDQGRACMALTITFTGVEVGAGDAAHRRYETMAWA